MIIQTSGNSKGLAGILFPATRRSPLATGRKLALFSGSNSPPFALNSEVSMTNTRANWLCFATFRHGSKAVHSSGVADVDARRATPADPRLRRWGLAGYRQVDPQPSRSCHSRSSGSRTIPDPLRAKLVAESASGMASASTSPPGATRNGVRFACVICYEKLRFPGISRNSGEPSFSTQVNDG